MENYALYTERRTELPVDEMRALVHGITPRVLTTDRGLTYVFEWPDLNVFCSEMPDETREEHLEGFEGYVRQAYGGPCDSRGERLVDRIRRTSLVVGVEVTPERDEAGRSEEIIGKLCGGLMPLVFFENAIYDSNARLILGPDGSFDPDSKIDE